MSWAWAWGFVGAGMWLSCSSTGARPSPVTSESSAVSTASSPIRPAASSAALADGSVVVATLHTKESELTILSSSGGLRYSLLDAAGIAKPMTLEQLRTYDPNLFEVVRAATARSRGGRPGATSEPGRAFLDARVEPPAPPAVLAPPPSLAPGADPLSAERAR